MGRTSDAHNGQMLDNGVAHVADGFMPSAYAAVKATSTTAASEALAAGVSRVSITNLDGTAANYLIVAFGTSPANAETNLAGGGEVIRADSEKTLHVPKNALGGGIAWKSAAGTPSMQLSQGN